MARRSRIHSTLFGAPEQIASGRYAKRVTRPHWRYDLFPEQAEFVGWRDKRRAALCGRRAGKTDGTAYWLIEGCEDAPGETSVFVALSAAHARMTLWVSLHRVAERHPELGLEFGTHQGQLMCWLPNGSRIWMAGARHRDEIEKFRGPRYRRVVVDEAGSFGPHLEELVEDVFEPGLMDLQGEIALTGSPPAVPAGYFYEITTGDHGRKQWRTAHWTVLQNPYIRHAAEWLARQRDQNGWALDHPRYVREYLGQWVRDEGALVFPYTEARNGYDQLRTDGIWKWVNGLDIGYNDPNAWVAEAYEIGALDTWADEVHLQSEMIPSETAAFTKQWQKDHPGIVVADTGGQGKPIAEEMRKRWQVYVKPAEKAAKKAAIQILRGDVLSGLFHVNLEKGRLLLDEWDRLQWDEKRELFDPRCAAHCSDAALYGHRECRTRLKKEQPTPPEKGTEDYARAEMARIREARAKQIKASQRRRGAVFVER